MGKKLVLLTISIFILTTPAVSYTEGYEESKPSKFNLGVKAEYKKLSNGDAILVNGTTNLPSKTVLYLALKTASQTMGVRKQIVGGSSFTVMLGPFAGKRFSPGSYTVEAAFLPSRQESEAVSKALADMPEIIASTGLTVGLAEGREEVTGKRRRGLVAELKQLELLYNEMNTEYLAQKKEFNKERWDSFEAKWRSEIKKIRDFDKKYHKEMIVMDYASQESMKMRMVATFEKLWGRYSEELFKANNLSFKAPPYYYDDKDKNADMFNKEMQELMLNAKSFIDESEKTPKEGRG